MGRHKFSVIKRGLLRDERRFTHAVVTANLSGKDAIICITPNEDAAHAICDALNFVTRIATDNGPVV